MIVLENICKDYGSKEQVVRVLNNISLEIEEGELLAIVGTSGSGKTTLLNIIGGMDSASSGKYFFDGKEVDYKSEKTVHKFRKENISFVFQDFALIEQRSVYENVEMPLIARKIKKRKKIVEEALTRMGIADISKKSANKISGGQKQRCAIARAMVSGSKVLLADEPTGALDKNTSLEIMKCFKDINELGTTVIIVTHDIDIANACDRIIRIEDGKIYE